MSHQHTRLLRIPSFLPSPEEAPSPPAPSMAKSGSLDSELSLSPKRNSISRTHKDKGPFHILSSASQTSKVPEGPSQTPGLTLTSSSTRLFGLAKPKDKKEKKKKSKGGRSQPGGESHAPLPVAALSLDPEAGSVFWVWHGLAGEPSRGRIKPPYFSPDHLLCPRSILTETLSASLSAHACAEQSVQTSSSGTQYPAKGLAPPERSDRSHPCVSRPGPVLITSSALCAFSEI